MPERQPKPAPRLSVDVVEDAGEWPAFGDMEILISRAAEAVATHAGVMQTSAEVTVALSSDAGVAALNGQFRGNAKPTNVLSFPAGPGAPKGFLGDIILAAETIAREASEQATPLEHHVQHLVVHGLLHLIGFDHEEQAGAERMEVLEIEILKQLGIENPYTEPLDTAKLGGSGDIPAQTNP